MKKKLFKKGLLAVSAAFALTALLMPSLGIKTAAASQMSSAGNANFKVIDISYYNVQQDSNKNYLYNKINWSSLKTNVKAIYIKATEGHTYTDPCYQKLALSAQSAGISHGFYHYFWPNANTGVNVQQADYFYNAIKNYGYDCIPVLDVEETNSSRYLSSLSKTQMTNAVTAFANEFKKKSGRDIMIYTSNLFIDEHFNSTLSKYKLWVARWDSGNPTDTTVWHKWDMWQYTASGAMCGLAGKIDCDKATDNIFLNSTSGKIALETPKGGNTYSGDITVSGWAISYYGVKRVDIYVDGALMGSVLKDSFTDRTSVDNIYGGVGYADALNSGYSYTIHSGKLTNGSHVVHVAAVDNKGNAIWTSKSTFTVDAPDDQTNIDSMSAAPYLGDISITGYAVSSVGVNKVDIYIDDECQSTIPNQALTDRADVDKQYDSSKYTDIVHSGFTYNIPKGNLADGVHVVKISETDNDGNVKWSAPATFTTGIPANKICIDRPSGACKGNVIVSGWAISYYGVGKVDISVDGEATASVVNTSMTQRTDVKSKYASLGYTDLEHSGFSYTLSSSSLSVGSHTVTVTMTDKNGQSLLSSQKTFTVSLPSDIIQVEKPSGTYTGDVIVSGWAISRFGINRVDIYVDGKKTASVANAAMTQRTDIKSKYASLGYTDLEHSGFSYTISGANLSAGPHTVYVSLTDKNGQSLSSDQKTFTVSIPSNNISLEKPSGRYTGDVNVSGFAISHYGVNRVDIYVDGKKTASVVNAAMTQRTDIKSKYASLGYTDLEHSGFSYTISGANLSGGSHTVRVSMTGKNGKLLLSNQRAFTVSAPANNIRLEKPSGKCSGSIQVSGWAISHYGIKRVDIYIDGRKTASVKNAGMTERKDIENKYKNLGYNDLKHSGFSYIVAKGVLSSGKHVIHVAMIDKSGRVRWVPQKSFTVKR